MTPNMKSLKAILLDDDSSQAYLLARFLEDVPEFDVELVHYTTSQEAMTDLLQQKADVVFLDHYLGEDRTGVELLQDLRKMGFEGAVVMMTGSVESGLADDYLRNGADAYLCKSDVDPVSLASAIRVALSLPHLINPRLSLVEPGDDREVG